MSSSQETWSPDTCGCTVMMDVSTIPPTWVSTATTCAAHTSLSGQALLNCLVAESVLKSNAVNQFGVNQYAVTGRILPAGTVVNFSLTGTAPNRAVSVTVSNSGVAPNAVSRSNIQTKLNAPIAAVTLINMT